MAVYKFGRIYKIITFESPEIYIGSTFDSLRNRFRSHKNGFKSWSKPESKILKCAVYDMFKNYGVEKCKIILVKEYQVVDKLQLQALEQLWMNKEKVVSINKQCSFQILGRQQRKNYRETNKDKIKQIQNEYRKRNHEKIREYKKGYYEENYKKIRDYKKNYREKNKEIIKEKKKLHYEKNRETIHTKNKKYYEEHKEDINEKRRNRSAESKNIINMKRRLHYEHNKELYKERYKRYLEKNKEEINKKGREKIKCLICNKEMNRTSLSRHNKRQH